LNICERTPPRLGDPHAGDLDRLAAGDYALGLRRGESGAHKIDICSTEKPCANIIASLQPSRQEASNSSARRRVAGALRLRALRRVLPTEDIVSAYGTAMCKSSRAGRT
jgi:hypothetical protein